MNLDKFTDLLLEGGAAVGEVSRVSRENVEPTIEAFNREILQELGITNFKKIGSTGKKSSSGDLDIAVELPEDLDYKEAHSKIQQMGYEVSKASPTTISVRFPIYSPDGETDEWAQIDMMFGKTDWLEFGYYAPAEGESQYTGAHRNFLLAAIIRYARELKGKEGKTWAIDLNRGLNRKTRGTKTTKTGKEKEVVLAKTLVTQRPEKVVDLLNITTDGDWELSDLKAPFEHLWQKTKKAFPKDVLDKIREYVGNASRVQKKEEPVMEQLVRKLSEEILNEGGSTEATTFFHESSFGIFVKNAAPKGHKAPLDIDVENIEEILNNYKVYFKEAYGSEAEYKKFSYSEQVKSTIKDARELAKFFRKTYVKSNNVSSVKMVGEDKAESPADVIVTAGKSELRVSLKKGVAQLANLGMGGVFRSFGENIKDSKNREDGPEFFRFLSSLKDDYKNKIDTMAVEWFELCKKTLKDIQENQNLKNNLENRLDLSRQRSEKKKKNAKNSKKIEDLEKLIRQTDIDTAMADLKKAFDKTKSISTFQEWWTFRSNIENEEALKRLSELANLGKNWDNIRKDTINYVLEDYFTQKMKKEVKNTQKYLKNFLVNALRLKNGKRFIFLSGTSKAKNVVFPKAEEFEKRFEDLNVQTEVLPMADFSLLIKVNNEDDELLLSLIVKFRWKNQQMFKNFSVSIEEPRWAGIRSNDISDEKAVEVIDKLFDLDE